jgi:hypothetical protein
MKKENRMLALGLAGGFVGGLLGSFLFQFLQFNFLSAASAANTPVLSATGFNLVDQQGRLRAQLGFSKEGPPGFWIFDRKGVARLAMGLYPDDTAHFGLQDKSGNMIELMRSFGANESPLLIFKQSGQDEMITGLNAAQRQPFLMYYEKNRQRKMQFGTYDGP